LVLSPHEDDETIGCGLLIAEKARRGIPIAVAVATDGRAGWFSSMQRPEPDDIAKIRHCEWHQALHALGVPREDRFELEFHDGDLSDHEDELTEKLVDIFRRVRPSQVFVTRPGDPHPDHRTLARAAGRAADRTTRPQLFTYRVYPAEGLWPEGRPSAVTAGSVCVMFARSILRLTARRPLRLRAPAVAATKVAAIGAYDSQSRLLAGELRYVWSKDVELYWPMELSSG
jgi:LmbE family N-acetylglucosaminyl deacetylase